MPKYCISRGWYSVETIEITAKSEEAALEKAKTSPDNHWKDTGGDTEIDYQVEWEE